MNYRYIINELVNIKEKLQEDEDPSPCVDEAVDAIDALIEEIKDSI